MRKYPPNYVRKRNEICTQVKLDRARDQIGNMVRKTVLEADLVRVLAVLRDERQFRETDDKNGDGDCSGDDRSSTAVNAVL